jgi:hypothetical protein
MEESISHRRGNQRYHGIDLDEYSAKPIRSSVVIGLHNTFQS